MYLIRLKMFKNNALLIVGGTGSFGIAALRRFLTTLMKLDFMQSAIRG